MKLHYYQKRMARFAACALTTVSMAVVPVHVSAQSYRTTVQPSGTLPVLYINVYNQDKTYNDEIIDINLAHKDYFEGEYWLDINDCEWMEDLGFKSVGSADEPLPLEIKARGNYTRTHFCKKPFKIKLGKKQNLLGLTPDKSKHYALLAHADDSYGFLRNFTGFEVAKRIGLLWTPSQQPVELVVNGDYRGLYMLTESIRVGDGRIMIEELDDLCDNKELASGGYLVELDNHPEDNNFTINEKSCVWGDRTENIAVTWDTPEEYSDLQKKFVSEQFNLMNNAIGSKNADLWKYMDMDDAVRYYIVMEICSHREAYRGSTYLARDRGEGQKWRFAPVWDFGHGFDSGTSNFLYNDRMFHNYWIASIVQNPGFQNRLKETWKWYMSNCFDGVYEAMDEYIYHIEDAAKSDWQRWQSVPRPNYRDSRDLQNNSNARNKYYNARGKMESKIKWLSEQWGAYDVNNPVAEPARDATPAAALPEYVRPSDSGVNAIAPESETTAEPVYYNLQGIKESVPTPGNIYIVVRGDKVAKEVFGESGR